MEFKQRLLGEMIAVQPESLTDETRDTTVRLPDWQRKLRGKVIAIGPGAPLPDGEVQPMECKVGDTIIFGATSGMESVYCGTPIRIMRDSDADAVVEA